MNPPSNEASGMQLPVPVAEQIPALGAPAERVQTPAEQAPGNPEMSAPAPSSNMPMPTMIPLPTAPAGPISTPQSGANATTSSSGVQVADDGDLIEKEWVEKAKMIVERNRDDPYKQSEELTMVKADYLQKRYNKTIKLNK